MPCTDENLTLVCELDYRIPYESASSSLSKEEVGQDK